MDQEILIDTPMGDVAICFSDRGIKGISLPPVQKKTRNLPQKPQPIWFKQAAQQIRSFLSGRDEDLANIPMDLEGISEFRMQVYKAAMSVTRGQTATYGDLARKIGKPQAARAIGQALRHNPIPLIIPCHRILGRDGGLVGFTGGSGLRTKELLIRLERSGTAS